jgi:hypothetical protein
MDYPRYNGHYVGVVVQNNDPLYRGRVKVFVPHISPTVYKGWNDNNSDKSFNFIGNITTNDISMLTVSNGLTGSKAGTQSAGSGSLTAILDDLKKILPWAEMSAPLAGGGSSGRYNATTGYGSISDSNNLDYTQASKVTTYSQNPDNIGEKPGNIYDVAYNRLSDAFNNPQLTNVNNVNKYSYDYTPESYSNSAKGSFPVLNVGAHVWIFFNEGDPLKPVVFGLSYGANDWSTIFDASSGNPGIDYPGTYENIKKNGAAANDINVRTYRNKYVINQKGGTISFVNTDNREILKFTHYSGSFKEFNNQANVELATNNDQKLVLGDSFTTIRGTRNEYTQSDYDNVVVGDNYRKIGNLNFNLFNKWKQTMEASGIPNIKQLFDIQRTIGINSADLGPAADLIKLNGTGQKKNGTPYLCPLCSSGEQSIIALNNSYGPEAFSITSNAPGYATAFGDNPLGFTVTLQGLIPSVGTLLNPLKTLFGFLPSPQLHKAGSTNTDLDGKSLTIVSGTLGQGIPCPVCNPNSPFNTGLANVPGITLKPGFSPSSFHGAWAVEPRKKNLPSLYQQVLPKLTQIEAQMGPGGSEIVEITKHKIETIGMVMNDWGAIRVDPLGKMSPAFVAVTPYMPVTVQRPTPLIEQVQVDDLPGGTYTLSVCNKYNILVGAGGVNLKTYGVVNIAGAITNVTGEQVNVGSANEVNIDGGKRLSLVGDIVSIRQRNNEQILMDSSVGITGNLVVKGGIFVEGNLTALSTSTLQLKRNTDQTKVTGRARAEATVGVAIPMDTAGVFDTDGQLVPAPGVGVPTYMGYTDPGQYIGWVPENTVVGSILIPGQSNPIKVYSNGFAVVGTGMAGSLPPVKDLRHTPAVSNVTPESVQLLNINGTLRGLPTLQVQKIYNAAKAGDKAALLAPMVVIGAGAHPDSIVDNPHSHTHNEGDFPSHAVGRMQYATSAQNGNVPTNSENHGPVPIQDPDYLKKTVNNLFGLLKGIGVKI